MKNNFTKNNKYLQQSLPQAQLDFHGRGILSETQIQDIAEKFIKDCLKQNLKKALIITGKGIHSKNKTSVVKPIITHLLLNSTDVKSFYDSRVDRGFEGAIEIVFN